MIMEISIMLVKLMARMKINGYAWSYRHHQVVMFVLTEVAVAMAI
jgi:hypothetical protein